MACDSCEDATRPCDELGIVVGVLRAPGAIGIVPAVTRELGGAIDVVPIRGIVQRQLVKDGYRLRIYIPYGRDWFPYFMRRLAERPANLVFFLRNVLRP